MWISLAGRSSRSLNPRQHQITLQEKQILQPAAHRDDGIAVFNNKLSCDNTLTSRRQLVCNSPASWRETPTTQNDPKMPIKTEHFFPTKPTTETFKRKQHLHQSMLQSHPFRCPQKAVQTDKNNGNKKNPTARQNPATALSSFATCRSSHKKNRQHWLNKHNVTKKPRLSNKLRTIPTTNKTDEEKSTFAFNLWSDSVHSVIKPIKDKFNIKWLTAHLSCHKLNNLRAIFQGDQSGACLTGSTVMTYKRIYFFIHFQRISLRNNSNNSLQISHSLMFRTMLIFMLTLNNFMVRTSGTDDLKQLELFNHNSGSSLSLSKFGAVDVVEATIAFFPFQSFWNDCKFTWLEGSCCLWESC